MKATREYLDQPGGLAERLQRLRKATGLTGDQLAERAGWKSRSKVPKIENGRQMPTEADIRAWAEICGAPDAETFTAMDTYPPDEAAKYPEIFDALMAEAVTGDEARRLIGAAATDLQAMPNRETE